MHFKDLSSSQKSVPLKGLLCNWPDCKAGPNGKRALA